MATHIDPGFSIFTHTMQNAPRLTTHTRSINHMFTRALRLEKVSRCLTMSPFLEVCSVSLSLVLWSQFFYPRTQWLIFLRISSSINTRQLARVFRGAPTKPVHRPRSYTIIFSPANPMGGLISRYILSFIYTLTFLQLQFYFICIYKSLRVSRRLSQLSCIRMAKSISSKVCCAKESLYLWTLDVVDRNSLYSYPYSYSLIFLIFVDDLPISIPCRPPAPPAPNRSLVSSQMFIGVPSPSTTCANTHSSSPFLPRWGHSL